jgi:hypothetical protein
MKTFWTILIALVIAGCSPIAGDSDFSLNPKEADAGSISQEQILFITEEAIYHHAEMRKLAANWCRLEEMVYEDADKIEIYEEMLGEHFDMWTKISPIVETTTFYGNKNSADLLVLMSKGASTIDLIDYMERNDCKTMTNETLVSSYIVFTQENDLLLNIDWEGVGIVDAIGLGLGGPGGAAAASGGVIVGAAIRELCN